MLSVAPLATIGGAPVTFTSPPSATVSKAPLLTDSPLSMFHVDPSPVTVACVPDTPKNPMVTPPLLLNVPPFWIVSEPGVKLPRLVGPAAVTVEPAPVTTMAESMLMPGPLSTWVSLPPLLTVSVPASTTTPSPMVTSPPDTVSPPSVQSHSVRNPPMLLVPVSVRCVPGLRMVRSPLPVIEPSKVVCLPPPMSRKTGLFGPITTEPAPASDPIWTANAVSSITSV